MANRWAWGILLALGCVLPGACSGSSNGGAPTARFKLSGDTPPNIMDVPFPTDAYLANGKIIDPIPGVDALVPRNSQYLTHAIAKLDGFGRAMFSFFYVDDPTKPVDDNGDPIAADIDPASLPINEDACVADTSSVFLIDLAPADPSKARIRCRGQIHDDSQTSSARPMVAVGAGLGIVLEEAHSYAAVLTSRVKDKSGAHLVASTDFQALLSGTRSGTLGTVYGNAIDKVEAALKSALDADKSTIVAIAPFTTHTASREMFKLRETLEDLPVPTLAWDAGSMAPMGAVKFAAPVQSALPAGFTASLDAWLGVAPQVDGADDPDYLKTNVIAHDKIAAIGTAVFQAANFLIEKPNGFTDLDHHTFARDASGNVIPNPDKPNVPIWVSFVIPKTAMPANGYPCVIVAHGSPGSRAEAFMKLANTFAAKGWIVAGIDAVTEGARSLDAKYQVDLHTDWESSPGATYVGPDGFADNVDPNGPPLANGRDPGLNLLATGLNFGAARDQLREIEIDSSQLVRVLGSNPDLSPLQTGATAPKIDGTKIAYYGGSMGAITGLVTAAIEPNVKLWALNVGGGQLFAHAAHAPVVQFQLQGALVLNFGITGQFIDETSLIGTLAEDAIDPFDPLIFASYVVEHPGTIKNTPLAPRNILQIEVLYDDEVGNDGTEAFARAAGFGLAVPNVGPNSHIDTMDMVRDPSKVLDPMPLPNVNPDGSGLIHDTPIAGVTSVLVQVTGQHYRNFVQSSDVRAYPVPFNKSTQALATDKQYSVAQSYVAQQAMVARFFDDGFQGNVPNVVGIPMPVRDVDEDGNPDATDPDPNDPTVK